MQTLYELFIKAAFAFGLAFGGITGINFGSSILCSWLFGNPQTPRRPPEVLTVLQEQDDTVAAERQEDIEHGSVDHAESSSSLTLQEAALQQYYAKVEQSILLQIHAKSDLVIANLKQCIQLQNNLLAGLKKQRTFRLKLKPGQQSPAALTSYGAYLGNLRLRIELKKEEICRLNKEKEILEKGVRYGGEYVDSEGYRYPPSRG